ncbi:hypothetical protein ACI5KX_09415 [Erythrobacter sp. GH1-10]|uniref:hypothetical protein n=1 Tax=Erythrobacter sp. GH1-10 TaxID=3349334 RepID=UPI003877E5AB
MSKARDPIWRRIALQQSGPEAAKQALKLSYDPVGENEVDLKELTAEALLDLARRAEIGIASGEEEISVPLPYIEVLLAISKGYGRGRGKPRRTAHEKLSKKSLYTWALQEKERLIAEGARATEAHDIAAKRAAEHVVNREKFGLDAKTIADRLRRPKEWH